MTGLLIDEFKVDRKTAALSLKEIIKVFTKDGTIPDDPIKAEIKEIREQAKLKGQIPVCQLIDLQAPSGSAGRNEKVAFPVWLPSGFRMPPLFLLVTDSNRH